MKSWKGDSLRIFMVCLLAVASAFGQSPEQRTKQILDQLLAHKFAPFYAMFSPAMKQGISLETFSQQMEQITSLGVPERIEEPSSTNIDGDTVVVIGVHWAPVSLNFQVSWNQAGEVDGTYWRPATPPSTSWSSPPYAHPDSFTEIEVTVGDDGWKLPGALTVPKGQGPFPAIVLVHGSGPNDRDESEGGAKPFRDIAEGLSSRGIAVLRYVKRTREHPECAADPAFTVYQETIEDAIRAAALVRKQPGIDPARVFVLGHSLGGYLAPRIIHGDPKLAGFVVMAGNVRSLAAVTLDQFEYFASLQGKLTADDQARLERIRKDPLAQFKIPPQYLANLAGYRPDLEAKQLGTPMLILQGERDYQVTMKDFNLWKSALAGRKNVSFRSYPALNHLFVAVEGKSSPAEYEVPGHVSEDVIADIAKWIQR